MSFLKRKIAHYLGLSPGFIRWHLFNRQDIDESELVAEYFTKIKNCTMLDIGFAWGDASIPFLLRGWQSYGFEPDSKSLTKQTAKESMLKTFAKLNVDSRAVSNVSGKKLTFYTSEESEGISSLHSFKSHNPSDKVTTVTLDDFITENNISDINFLKIDTEGHDLFVLQGLTLNKTKPKVILTEFDDFKTIPLGYTYKDIADLLTAHGYTVYLFEWFPIEKYGISHKFRSFSKYPKELHNPKGWGNFIAVELSESEKFDGFLNKSRYNIYYEK